MIPDAYYKDIYSIDYSNLKKIGIKNLFFDIDNTLMTYQDEYPPDRVKTFVKKLKYNDFNVSLISNARYKRVSKIAKHLDIEEFYYLSLKPFKKNYKKILNKHNIDDSIFIGDQFTTDLIGAKRNNFKFIFVDRMNEIEPLNTRLLRLYEKKLMKKYKKENLFEKYKYYDNLK